MVSYVSGISAYACSGGSGYAKSLASTQYWYDTGELCTPGDNLVSNNATGFSAVPTGYRYDCYGEDMGYSAWFWTSYDNGGQSDANTYYLSDWNSYMYDSSMSKYYGCSVRCVKNE